MSLVKDRQFYKVFFYLTFSVALRNIIVFMVNLADSVMLGQYSEQALSGVALVNQIQFILQLMVTGICEGGQIFISRAWGNRDTATMQKTANIAMKLSLIIAFVIAAAAAIFPSQILSLLSTGQLWLNITFFKFSSCILNRDFVLVCGYNTSGYAFAASITAHKPNAFSRDI